MKVAIGGRGVYRHITGNPTPPQIGEKGYTDWEEIDLIVFSWIIDNMEAHIIADFAHHQMAKSLWDTLAVTFASSADSYLIYDLRDKASRVIQGEMSLEAYWSRLHGLWMDIDRCPHKTVDCCDKGVSQYRSIKSELRLFKFLTGLNERYDWVRREILKEDPYPSVDEAYGWVEREATRLKIMPPASESPTTATGIDSSSGSSEVGFGFGSREYCPNRNQPLQPPRFIPTAGETLNPTSPSFGAPIVECTNTQRKRAFNWSGTQNGGKKRRPGRPELLLEQREEEIDRKGVEMLLCSRRRNQTQEVTKPAVEGDAVTLEVGEKWQRRW